jgi:hypothetical protein
MVFRVLWGSDEVKYYMYSGGIVKEIPTTGRL